MAIRKADLHKLDKILRVKRLPHPPGPGYPLLGDWIVTVTQEGPKVAGGTC
jgi:hypothetical protein